MTVPTDISGLVRWYKADALSLNDNDLVSSWADSSGVGGALTAAGSARPTYLADRMNGLPGVVFSGAQKIASTDQTSRPSSAITVFLVAANYKRGASPMLLAWGGGSTQGFNIFGSTGTDANNQPPAFIVRVSGGAWGDDFAITSLRPGRGDPCIITGYRSGSATKIRVDGTETSDTGTVGNIDYTTGAGTLELSLGDKGSSAGPFHGVVHEVIIYDRALTAQEILDIESYLDAKWGITKTQAEYLCLFNGTVPAGTGYAIGLAWSVDGRRWRRHHSNPVLTPGSSGAFDDDHAKDPYLLWDGTEYIVYYSGYDGSHFQIGVATSSDGITWNKYGSNPVISVGSSGAFDENGCSFPVVVKDDSDPDSSRRWKMWYAGVKASDGKLRIGYAYSGDGLSWTKHGQVLDVGSGGAWDDEGVLTGTVYLHDSTWYLFYGGRQGASNPVRWQGGVATFTDPEGTYTKIASNPTMKARFNDANKDKTLTSNLTTGSRVVSVADTSGFSVHEQVVLYSTAPAFQGNRILTIDSSTQMTLERVADADFNTSATARIRSFAYNSAIARSIRKADDGTFEGWGTVFQPVDDLASPQLREASQRFTLATLTSDWVYDDSHGHLAMLEDTGNWDEASAENPSVLGPAENAAPTVSAGNDQSITLPATASLDGTVSDDGLPSTPGSVTTTWSKVSGPGTVTFGDSAAVDTTASFSLAGTYVLQLEADDGALTTTDTVTITVSDPSSLTSGNTRQRAYAIQLLKKRRHRRR